MKLEQVGLRVTNFQRSLRFYTGALGLKLRARGDTRGWGGGLWAQLEDPRSHRVVELNRYPRGSLFGSPYSAGDGVDHLDFTIGVAPVAALEREDPTPQIGREIDAVSSVNDGRLDGQCPRS